MLTRIEITNFKRFGRVSIELGNPVVFVGPNNSGKTTALQAIALWDLGAKLWLEKNGSKSTLEPAVINRLALTTSLVPEVRLLWNDLETGGRIEITLHGSSERDWQCGFSFAIANAESILCVPVGSGGGVPAEIASIKTAYLQPLSGLSDREFVKQAGELIFLIGQGRTAEVLRNLCFLLRFNDDGWDQLVERINRLFGVSLLPPAIVPARGEITLSYQERSGAILDISCAGRGLQQVLLLLVYLAEHPNSVILIDEPDAHLEFLRQRQIYQQLVAAAKERNSQLVIATHSEVVLNEAAQSGTLISFVGKPHRLDRSSASQTLKALKDIGFEHYYAAEEKGWVLYLEGSTDLAILQAFAQTSHHPAAQSLSMPFVQYVANDLQKARDHFYGLRESKPDLLGFLLCDQSHRALPVSQELREYMWRRREIENYLCQPETLYRYADSLRVEDAREVMVMTVAERVPPIALIDPTESFWSNTKVSEDFLTSVFAAFFKKISRYNVMAKSNFYELAVFVPKELIDPEVKLVLDMILMQSDRAQPFEC